jgi:hypothetical protein
MRSILEVIEDQLVANRLPLAGVTLAALPFPNTPAVLSLHWHAFVEIPPTPQRESTRYQPVPSSALQLTLRWDEFEDLETDVLEASWELGAWDLRRIGAVPCGASAQRYAECLTSFGVSGQEIDGDQLFVADVPDGPELVDAAARAGYVRWQFRPTWCGLWKDLADDVTLQAGGYRNPLCPVGARSLESSGAGTLVFQLGKSKH